MSKSIRIRTTPGSDNQYLKFQLEQDFDFLEILSLKLTQEDVYRRYYSDYGVVVGRVIMNNGVGVPNARVSIFIPVDDEDNEELKSLYPYKTITDKNDNGYRYNLFPNTQQKDCHVSIGTFPSKREILDNEDNLEIFEKYYKYTAVTNGAGDYMIFGVPVGNHMLNVDVDISDMGIFSQRPYDLIEQGTSEKLFTSTTQFKKDKNLNSLAQVKSQKMGINVLPFWGDKQRNEIGITRNDFELNYDLKPKAIFIGGSFSDNEKNSINKNCQTSKKAGKICETIPNDGRITMIRKRLDNEIEDFSIDGGDVVDEDGTWAYQIPMNLDFMITDEFGKLIPSEDPNKGIPTRASVRFKFESYITGGEGRLRTRANYLIPHNPKNTNELDYEFGEQTKESSFRNLYWNKIYTVKNYIPRFQHNDGLQNRRFVGFKDVDDCVGTKNPTPFNRLDTDFNPLYIIICVIVGFIIDIMGLVNGIMRAKILGNEICDIVDINCARIKCMDKYYAPNCKGTCYNNRAREEGNAPYSDKESEAKDCFQITLAEALNVYELDFYNDWINGSLYSLLLKYKKKKGTGNDKFCDVNDTKSNYLHDTLINDTFGKGGHNVVEVKEGLVKSYKDELFYAPTTKDGRHKLFATDIVNLGTVNKYDWQGQYSIHEYLTPTSFKLPPFVGDVESYDYTPVVDYGSDDGLLFHLNCLRATVNKDQVKNIKRICELGVGIDEDRSDEPGGFGKDGKIKDDDIDNQFSRDVFMYLNDTQYNTLPDGGLQSGFEGSDYIKFRGFKSVGIPQSENSFYFYFGIHPNKTAIDKMNKKYFKSCVEVKKLEYGEE